MRTKRSLWPISIVVFFALAIAGAVVFVAFCNLHPTDLVAADYYEQEVRYQQEMEQVRRTRQLSETPGVSFIAEQRLIRIAVPAAHAGADLTGAIHLYRPSDATLDQHLKLAVDAKGLQDVSTAGLEPGLWKVKVQWKAGGADYLLDEKVLLPRKAS
jgi:nitrogen fixation protein FixH